MTFTPEIKFAVRSSGVSTPLLEKDSRKVPSTPKLTLFPKIKYRGIAFSKLSIAWLTSPYVSDEDSTMSFEMLRWETLPAFTGVAYLFSARRVPAGFGAVLLDISLLFSFFCRRTSIYAQGPKRVRTFISTRQNFRKYGGKFA